MELRPSTLRIVRRCVIVCDVLAQDERGDTVILLESQPEPEALEFLAVLQKKGSAAEGCETGR